MPGHVFGVKGKGVHYDGVVVRPCGRRSGFFHAFFNDDRKEYRFSKDECAQYDNPRANFTLPTGAFGRNVEFSHEANTDSSCSSSEAPSEEIEANPSAHGTAQAPSDAWGKQPFSVERPNINAHYQALALPVQGFRV